jgi:trimeric autotransporter adhesin
MKYKLFAVFLGLTAICQHAVAQGVMTTFAGSDWVFPGDGKPALNAPLGFVRGIAIDPFDGNPVFADYQNCIVAKILSNGNLSVVAGNGFCITTGNGGPATSAGLNTPSTVAFDTNGNMYIGEFPDVRKVSTDGTITTLASAYGANGVVVDSAGNVYFADEYANRIQKIAPDLTVSIVAGTGAAGYSGDGGKATSATLNVPSSVALDAAGNLYITDTNNNAIRKVSGGIITTVFANLNYPESIAFDNTGAMYVGELFGLYKAPPSLSVLTRVAGTAGAFRAQVYVAPDNAGNVYVADMNNLQIKKVSTSGTVTILAGNGKYRYGGEGVPAVEAPLNTLLGGLAIGPGPGVYFSDFYADRVYRVDSQGILTTFAGTGGNNGPTDGPATKSDINGPIGLTFDLAGNLYIGDNGNQLARTVNPAGIISTYAAMPEQPNRLAFDRATGNLYVSTYNDSVSPPYIYRVDPTHKVRVYAGTGVSGYYGDGGQAISAQLHSPAGLTIDPDGNLLFADGNNHRVRKITPQGIITTIAGNGTAGWTGDGFAATQATLNGPSGLGFDNLGNLYIADSGNARVRKVTPYGVISTVAGGGPRDVLGDGKLATKATLGNPVDVAADSGGNLYIVDAGKQRIREVLATPPTMQVSPTSVSFTAASGGAPVTQTVSVAGFNGKATITGLDFTVAVSPGGNDWLTVDTSADSTPRLLTLTADPSGLAQGSYAATVTVSPLAATPSTLTVTVTFQVGPPQSPLLAVDKTNLSFTMPQGVTARTASLLISNQGGQVLNYTAAASTRSGGNWLAVSSTSGQASPGSPSTLSVQANPGTLAPGTYTGQVSIQPANSSTPKVVAVSMTVSANKQAVLLTQSGLTFTAVAQGGIIPPQFFGVINVGTGVMNWTATTTNTKGPNWLQVSPASGSSDPSKPAPQVTVSVNPGGLPAGAYYGTVFVDAKDTANLSRLLTVFLRVLPAGTAVAASVQPPELVFNPTPGGGPPGSKIVNVYNIAATPRSFVSARSSGAFELYSLPGNGTLDPNHATPVVVQPNGSFSSGTYKGELTFQFSDGTIQTVKITVASSLPQTTKAAPIPTGVVRAPAAGSSGSSAFDAVPVCPGPLTVKSNALSPAFQVEAGWKVGLNLSVADACGNAVQGSPGDKVWASFSDSEDNLDLLPLGDGTWQQSWKPANNNQGVTITVHALSGSLSGQNVISGGLGSANDQPQFSVGGVLSVFDSAAVIRPLAPGSFITIYGSNLADGVALTSTPSATLAGVAGAVRPYARARILRQSDADQRRGAVGHHAVIVIPTGARSIQ